MVLSERILDWLKKWKGITYRDRQAEKFADDIENTQYLSTIQIHNVTEGRQEIQKLLTLLSPSQCRMVSIEPVPDADKDIRDTFGGRIRERYTLWLAYSHPRNRIRAVVFANQQHNHLQIQAKRVALQSDYLFLQEVINRGLSHNDILHLLESKPEFSKCMIDPEENFFSFQFGVEQNDQGDWVSTVDDATLWPDILPLIAYSVGLHIVHIPHPTPEEVRLLQTNPLYTHGHVIPEEPIALFRTHDNRALFGVIPRLHSIHDDIPRPFADGRRIFLRVDTP
jgi:hypothetical protein